WLEGHALWHQTGLPFVRRDRGSGEIVRSKSKADFLRSRGAAFPGADASSPAPECPICFAPYDNAFRTPLLLPPCAHTFCLQCLAQMCLYLKTFQSFQCPLCRAPVPLPLGGVPCLPPNMEVVALLPPDQRGNLQRVWLERSQLCYWKPQPAYNPGPLAPGPGQDVLVKLQLTGSPLGHPAPGQAVNLVTVRAHRRPLACQDLCHSFWCLLLLVAVCFVALFCTIFFPI
uniref:RING-type domain-containing protein n=1 Tax=Lepisosteus oculatus TaxID=7918 RepID=W5M316_LEPOC